MPNLAEILGRLGLQQYQQPLVENGFESWDILVDITEEDLKELGFKMGHRRALQREIASYRGIPPVNPLTSPEPEALERSQSPGPPIGSLDGYPFPAQGTPTTPSSQTFRVEKEGKRRYRRHPKPDSNAPKKPRTAYVNFADKLRLDPAVNSLSFVDIAKEVGRRWQNLPGDEKHQWECAAAKVMQEYESSMENYKRTEQFQQYQDYLEDFRKKQIAAKERKQEKAELADRRMQMDLHHDMPSRNSSGSPTSLGSVPTPEMDKYHDTIGLAMKELASMRQELGRQELFTAQRLPPRALIEESVQVFQGSTSSVLFAWPREHLQILLDRMYSPVRRAEDMTLAEGFILAALGGYYSPRGMTDLDRRILHASATALLQSELPKRNDYLRAMRLFLCLSYFSTLEKHISARYLTSAGLKLARWKYADFMRLPDGDSWRRVYRSLVYMDSWLSSTLGYPSEMTPIDVANACLPGSILLSVDDAIHYHSTAIMTIGSEISGVLSRPENATQEKVRELLAKVDSWNRTVPNIISLQGMELQRSPHLTLSQQQAVLMLHILYLTTIIQIYQYLLAASTHTAIAQTWNPHFANEIRTCHQHCAKAATQIAQLLTYLNGSGSDQRRRWWLRIHSSYQAGVALLYAASQALLAADDEVVSSIETNTPQSSPQATHASTAEAIPLPSLLASAKICIDSLAPAAPTDRAAATLLAILRPKYQTLENLASRPASNGTGLKRPTLEERTPSASSGTSTTSVASVASSASASSRTKISIHALLDGPSTPTPAATPTPTPMVIDEVMKSPVPAGLASPASSQHELNIATVNGSPGRPTSRLKKLEVLPVAEELMTLLRDPVGRLREGWSGSVMV